MSVNSEIIISGIMAHGDTNAPDNDLSTRLSDVCYIYKTERKHNLLLFNR